MKLNNLQILRGISALLVCCFHFKDDLNFADSEWGNVLFGKGSVGVPIFFVISGYIMVYSTKKFKNDEIKSNMISFIKKRVIRIIPLYYLLTLGWMILGGSVLLYFQDDYFSRLIHSILFLPQNQNFPVLFLGWSLNYEMFFYLIFAISLLFQKWRYFAILLFFSTLILLGFLFSPENAFLKMITGFLNVYFLLGIVLGLSLDKIKVDERILTVFSVLSICIFILYLFNIISISNPFINTIPILLFVITFLIFDLFLKVKANSFLKMTGDISYSIYLCHPFVGILFTKFQTDSVLLSILLFLIKIVLVIFISKVLYELVEKRFTQFLKEKWLPQY
ncbi:acyltransferase family protein [Chryseobacterium sp. MP_3.2]|uniref:acyltransferase family protein n=1 Tax=Chryseobacterium sp. MP_3.2 TaxID=3071712 RepID=UPI002E070F45|nr:exopolysaccharide production protein ExoZ [Chryseobacterium sp. MP_3.2]